MALCYGRDLRTHAVCTGFANLAVRILALLGIGDRCGSGNNTALRRHARLGLSALDKLRAGMSELSRLEHRTQVDTAASVAECGKCDHNHRNNNCNRHVTMPACRIKPATAGGTAANVAKRAIVFEL